MTRVMAAAALAAAIVGLSAGARGQDAAAPAPRQLTLEQALAEARRVNRSLVVERARLAQAHTNIDQAWAALFPVVTAQGKYTRNYKNAVLDFGQLFTALGITPTAMAGSSSAVPLTATILKQNELDASINATMPLVAPAAYPALEAVKTGYRSSEAGYESSEDNVLFTVAQTFYAAAVADEVVGVRQSAIGVARATLTNAKTRFDVGTVTKVDVDRAELALVRAEQAELDARYGQTQAYRALATLIQADAPFVARPIEAAPATPDGSDLDTALRLRPEFRGFELQRQSADATRRAYAWKWAPTLSAFGKAAVGNYKGFTGDYYSWAAGVQLDWTLFDGGTRDAQRRLAAAQAAEADARADVLRDSIRDDLANNRSLLDTKQQAVQASVRGVGLARETVDLVRAQYEAGTITEVDLLTAQDNLVSAEEALAQSRFDVAIADLTLRRAAGTFPAR